MAKHVEQDGRTRRWEGAWVAAGLVVLTVLAYGPALTAGFIWDDDDYVRENPTLRSVEGLKRIWTELGAVPQYYPLTHTTFWVEYRLWGVNPKGYHATNVLLHAGSAILLWRILRRLKVPGAMVAAGLFAVHPVNVESVAWITERKNTLSLFFYLLAGYSYIRFLRWGSGEGGGEGEWVVRGVPERDGKWYGVAFLCFVAALCSKTVTSTWPAALVVVMWWRGGKFPWKDVILLVPFLIVGGAFARITGSMEVWHVGARGAEWDFSLVERVLIAGRAVWFYAGKLVVPWKLTFIYPRWNIDAGAWWQWLFPVGGAVVLAGLWGMRKRIGRGAFAVAALFAGTLTPALGFFNVYPMRYSFVADHFIYHAGVFGVVGVAAGGWLMARRMKEGETKYVTAGGILIAIFAGLTFNQSRAYESLETLWRDTLAKNPGAWVAHNNLGGLLIVRGDVAEATAHFRAAMKLRPGEVEAVNGLGEALLAQGKVDEAIELFQEAVRLEPNHAIARDNLGTALREKGEIDAAIAAHRRSVAIQPDRVNTRVNLANAYIAKGDLDGAYREYQAALGLDPNRPSLRNGLGILLASQGRLREALLEFQRAVALEPGSPESHTNLGIMYEKLNDPQRAEQHYREALRLRPGYELAMRNLRRLRGQ